MVLEERGNLLEVLPVERVPSDFPTPGDTRFSIRIRSGEFCGAGTAWIDLPTLQKFAGELAEVDAKRSGQAKADSISPGNFCLIIKAIDGWGHTAVSGRLAKNKQAIEFEFEFSPDHLPELASEFRELVNRID